MIPKSIDLTLKLTYTDIFRRFDRATAFAAPSEAVTAITLNYMIVDILTDNFLFDYTALKMINVVENGRFC